jgi:hypothetical protein
MHTSPQSDDDLARPSLMRAVAEHDPLTAGQPQYPVASWYGSVDAAERSTSPLWVSGPIQEDSEAVPPFGPNTSLMEGKAFKKVGGRDRRKRKQRKLRAERRQQEQTARERAVSQGRGKPQEVRWQDLILLSCLSYSYSLSCAFFRPWRHSWAST